MTVPAVKPASPAQINFLVALSAERTPHVTEAAVRSWGALATSRNASEKITWLKAQPVVVVKSTKAQPVANVPAGHYAVDRDGVSFYRIDVPTEGRWAGYTFVKIQASDDFYPVRGRDAATVLAAIEADGIDACMARYGIEIGRCGKCNRTLTDETSRALGIGPVCRAM